MLYISVITGILLLGAIEPVAKICGEVSYSLGVIALAIIHPIGKWTERQIDLGCRYLLHHEKEFEL